MKKLILLCCSMLILSGCVAAIAPAVAVGVNALSGKKSKITELPEKTHPTSTSNILFVFDKTQTVDWNKETDTVAIYAGEIKKFYSVKDLLSQLRSAPNSLKLELQEQNWIGVDGQVVERNEMEYKAGFKGERTWAGSFEFSDGINEVMLLVNEYSKPYFSKKKTGQFIDVFCPTNTAEITTVNEYLNSHRLVLRCWPVSQETTTTHLENPNKK